MAVQRTPGRARVARRRFAREPIDPQQATERVLTALVAADAALGATADTLSGARRYSNRLKLTDAAAEVREQRLTAAQRRQRPDRSR
ncbi:hypothetical protein [Nocardia gipuzkoensis]